MEDEAEQARPWQDVSQSDQRRKDERHQRQHQRIGQHAVATRKGKPGEFIAAKARRLERRIARQSEHVGERQGGRKRRGLGGWFVDHSAILTTNR
jgi:hypothetical protein